MNLRTCLCLTACSVVLLSGCGETSKNLPQTTSTETSNLDALLAPDTTVTPQGQPTEKPLNAKVYIYNSVLQKPDTPVELTDSAYFMTLDSLLHWVENQKILNIPGSAPHSVKATENLAKMPFTESGKGVIMDAWGDSETNKASLQLSGTATFSVMDLKDADLKLLQSGNLTTLALRMENANVVIHPAANITTHALYVGKNTQIINGKNIKYVTDGLSQFGMTMQQLNIIKHKRFPWANEGEFMVAGKVDYLTLTPGVKLYTQGIKARIDVIDQKGGTIELTSTAPFKCNTYLVNAPGGTVNVIWDEASTIPLMQVGNSDVKHPVSVVLSQVNSAIKVGDKLTLIETSSGTLTPFQKGVQTFAASFDLSNTADKATNAHRLILTLTGKDLTSTGLSYTESNIARQILAHDEKSGTMRVALLDTASAQHALHDITKGTHLSAIRTTPLSFDGFRDGNHHATDAGIIYSSLQNGTETQTFTGLNITPDMQLGISLTHPSIVQQLTKSNVAAVHAQYQQLGFDGFASADGLLSGANLGLSRGTTSTGYAAFNVATLRHLRYGSSETVFGRFIADALNETHVFCNVTLKKRIVNVDFSAQFFTEIHASRSAYTARLDTKDISIPAEQLPLTYGVQFQTSFAYDCGHLVAGYGLTKDTAGYAPSFSLLVDVEL